jgi:nitrogen fixation NifU-like protein
VVTEAMRALARAAEGAGQLDDPRARSSASEHPVCGDELQLHVLWDGDTIAQLRWQAAGCPATLAVAAVAARALPGASLAQAPARLRRELARLGDLGAHERHAEQMLLAALARTAG